MSDRPSPVTSRLPDGQSTHYPDPLPPVATSAGRSLGIAGFVMSFFAMVNIVGLVLCIVALRQSKRAGHKNGFALAGLVLSIVGILALGIIVSLIAPTLIHAAQDCARLGTGTHIVGNSVLTCSPTEVLVSPHR
jgi:uncharacterized membrane protein